MKKIFLIAIFFLIAFQLRAGTEAPAHMKFCGMDLSLTQEARDYINEQINKLHRSESYFNGLVDRANLYMPFVEEAFDMVGVPQDLRYIVLQESALKGDAVSTSNAVGFWQFKELTGKEVGLSINGVVDERMHIFKSSVGAARYFHRLHTYFGNWIYAVIAYNRGASGALPFTDVDLFCQKKMTITKETHWYALKAIAHKIAFEDEIGKTTSSVRLKPVQAIGDISISKLSQQNNMETNEFRSYNLWILKQDIPGNNRSIYYVPTKSLPEGQDPPIKETKPIPVPKPAPVPQPKPVVVTIEKRKDAIYLTPTNDPDYGVEYVYVREGQIMLEIARSFDKNYDKLNLWNGISRYERVATGTFIKLKPTKRMRFHITRKGENLGMIADDYGIDLSKIRKLNRSLPGNDKVVPGQKVYLKTRKPKTEKLIILETDFEDKPEVIPIPTIPAPVISTPILVSEPVKVTTKKSTSPHAPFFYENELRLPVSKPKWIVHKVAEKESIWKISKQYNWPVNLIKKVNNLSSDQLKPGTELKILSVE